MVPESQDPQLNLEADRLAHPAQLLNKLQKLMEGIPMKFYV